MNVAKEKINLINKLNFFKEKIILIENEFNLNFPEIKQKLENSLNNIKNNKFSIAFFGAYSDGKSTILSTLLKRFDIKISPLPTTDKIEVYNYKDYEIIDTPGLFSEKLLHDEITKKYISEANVVIYTVDPVNPLKTSHHDTLKWLLVDLKKVDSTIFVINKMDEVADLEDDEDFYENCKIKKEVVKEIIYDVTGVKNFNRIICISADPFGLGLDYWKNNLEYKNLSRITQLEQVLDTFVKEFRNELIEKAGISVIEEICLKIFNDLKSIKDFLKLNIEGLENQINEYSNRAETFQRKIKEAYLNIKENLISLRENIILEIEAANNKEELNKVIIINIGKDGYVLKEKIELLMNKEMESLEVEFKNTFKNIENSLEYHLEVQNKINNSISKYGKEILIKGIKNIPTRKLADTLIKTRNILKIPYKFKPWEALKIAKIFQKTLPVVFEFFNIGTDLIKTIKFNKKKSEIKNGIEDFFKKFLESFSYENFLNLFPLVEELNNLLQDLEQAKISYQDRIKKIDTVLEEINTQRMIE